MATTKKYTVTVEGGPDKGIHKFTTAKAAIKAKDTILERFDPKQPKGHANWGISDNIPTRMKVPRSHWRSLGAGVVRSRGRQHIT
jgi:hypothetical protein